MKHDAETIRALYIRVCRDSNFALGTTETIQFAAQVLEIHPMEVWGAFPCYDDLDKLAAGTHSYLTQETT